MATATRHIPGRDAKSATRRARKRPRTTSKTRRAATGLRGRAAPLALDALAAAVDLGDFLKTAGVLTLSDRQLIVAQGIVLFEQNYVHLPLKVAMHAVNPLQRLRLLAARLERQTTATMDPEWRFHAELSEIFHSVRDLHTNYLLPNPFNGKIAFLPFLVEEFQDNAGSHYIVSHLTQGFAAPGFGPGAEITHWNGIPIERAVDLNADRFAGSNLAARRSRGVESLTVRSLRIHRPPDEQWGTVSYIGTDAVKRELTEKWKVVDNLPPIAADPNAVTPDATAIGLDLGGDEVARARRMLFAPASVAQEAAVRATGVAQASADNAADLATSMPSVFRARTVTTASGTFGHIRIFTFSVNDPDAFVAEFVRLIGLLPQDGLIVDVRGNGGGHIFASEFTLQTLTPRRIEPEPVEFVNTPLNFRIVRKHKGNPAGIDLGPWFPSMNQALETGSVFSSAFPITPVDGANDIGQRYNGPVVLIVDARCYSATDIFAAGFQDHAVGPVLGVDDNTGAGGANVWTLSLLKQLLELPTQELNSPYKDLPGGAGMRVAIRRTIRVGPRAGTPVEDLGVTPDVRHRMTANDVLQGNVDLLERAGQLLAAIPVRRLDVVVTPGAGGTLTVQIQSANLDRADIFVDDRPRSTVDLAGASTTVTVSGVPGAASTRVEGYVSGTLAAVRTVTV
jgi:Peptidase family S41